MELAASQPLFIGYFPFVRYNPFPKLEQLCVNLYRNGSKLYIFSPFNLPSLQCLTIGEVSSNFFYLYIDNPPNQPSFKSKLRRFELCSQLNNLVLPTKAPYLKNVYLSCRAKVKHHSYFKEKYPKIQLTSDILGGLCSSLLLPSQLSSKLSPFSIFLLEFTNIFCKQSG